MTVIQSYIFYGLLVLASLLLAWYSERSGKKRGLVLCALLLIVVAGFRAYDVGIDTLPYKNGIEYFFETGQVSWETSFSYGYGLLTSYLLGISNYTFVLLAQAAITNGLILARFWDFKDTASLTFMVLVYISTAYFVSFCIICQYVAIALVFYGSRFADKGRPFVYCMFIVAAAALHTSALIAFVDIALRYFRLKGSSPIGLLLRLTAIAVAPVAIAFIGKAFFARYASYGANASSVGLMVAVQIAVFVTALLVCGYFFGKDGTDSFNLKTELSLGAPYVVRLYSFGLILSAGSYVIANAGRIAYYFTIYGAVCFGAIAKHSTKSKSRLACSMVLFSWFTAYCIYAVFINGSLGIVPFSFVWG